MYRPEQINILEIFRYKHSRMIFDLNFQLKSKY